MHLMNPIKTTDLFAKAEVRSEIPVSSSQPRCRLVPYLIRPQWTYLTQPQTPRYNHQSSYHPPSTPNNENLHIIPPHTHKTTPLTQTPTRRKITAQHLSDSSQPLSHIREADTHHGYQHHHHAGLLLQLRPGTGRAGRRTAAGGRRGPMDADREWEGCGEGV